MRPLLVTMLIFGMLTNVSAQTSISSVLGLVRDPQGGVVPGASVSVVNEQTKLQRSATTDATGEFEVSPLPIGSYAVVVKADGFRSWKQVVTLTIDQKVRVEATLELGATSEVVTVRTALAALETDSTSVGEVIRGDKIVDLPLNGRNFLGLVNLQPATTPAPRDFRSTEPGSRGASIPSAAGGRPEDNSYELDGMDNREIGRGNYAISPSIDSIAEFKVTNGIPSAEHGRVASASIELVTKSGTNQYHGSLFEFVRNDAMDARNFFERSVGALKRNQFGGSVGAPIIRNKHFVFGTYERFIERSAGSPAVGLVPTDAMRGGVFPTIIVDPLNNRTAFGGNTIPLSRIDPISTKVMEYFPRANASDPARNFNFTRDSTHSDKNMGTVRSDHNLGQRDLLYFRYSIDDEKTKEAPRLPTGVGAVISSVRAQGFTINETHTFGPGMINQTAFGWTRFRLNQVDNFAFQKDIAKELGIQFVGLGSDPLGWAFPAITMTGYLAPAGNFPAPRGTDIYQIRDTVFLQRGKHSLRIGGDFRRYSSDLFSPGQLNGSFTFQGSFTNNAFADLLLGWPLNAIRNINPAAQNAVIRYLGLFIADDWKVTDRLTMNIGVRYELESVIKERQDELVRFDLQSGRVLFSPSTRERVDAFYKKVSPAVPYAFFDGGLYNLDANNLAPRIGLAYRPFQHQKTVIRSGFGAFYNAPQMTTLLSSVSAPPFSIRPSEVSGTQTPQVRWNPSIDLTTVVVPPFTCFCMTSPDFPYSYVLQWATNVQQMIGRDASLEIGYIGSHTLRLISFGQRNLTTPGPANFTTRAPYPQWDRIQSNDTGLNAKYHALTVKAEKQMGSGFSFLAAYTFSKAIDQASTWNQVALSRPDGSRTAEVGLADFDVRHRTSFTYSYELPFGAGRRYFGGTKGVASRLVSGWGVRGITTLASGFPLNVVIPSARLNAGSLTPRPDRIRDGNLPSSERTIDRWFDTGAFPLQPLYVVGNSGRNVLAASGSNFTNLVLVKSTRISEGHRLEFRVEMFNAFNHPTWGSPALDASVPRTFGVVSSATAPRIIQLGLKWYF